ncbi:hypothetical protein A2U01_0031489, partial [Trifolium medium]|nr:hypothetical protein [Trifolium medium]
QQLKRSVDHSLDRGGAVGAQEYATGVLMFKLTGTPVTAADGG